MNKLAALLTPYSGDGKSQPSGFRPTVADFYPLRAWRDATAAPAENLPPDVNALVIEARLDEMTLAEIEDDPAFFVLWEEDL